MNKPPPVSFEALAKSGGSSQFGGPPYQIRGSDLDKNFIYATLQADDSLIIEQVGPGGHIFRKLNIPKIPLPPSTGTYVLGAVDGTIKWIATEAC